MSTHTLDEYSTYPKYHLFDIWLNALTLLDIQNLLQDNIGRGRKFILANQNLHSLYICTQTPKVREFFAAADYTHIDGTSLVFLGKLKGLPIRLEHRCGYMDLFPALLPTFIENGWRVFYLGSRAEVLEEGLKRLRTRYPGLTIEGHHGFFDKTRGGSENSRIIEQINAFRPNILFVGMGMPLQELWILDNYANLDANVVLHCGGMIDYLAGAIPTPPRWLGPLGLEWAFRLVTEPRRLWWRYVAEPLQLLIMLLKRKLSKSR